MANGGPLGDAVKKLLCCSGAVMGTVRGMDRALDFKLIKADQVGALIPIAEHFVESVNAVLLPREDD